MSKLHSDSLDPLSQGIIINKTKFPYLLWFIYSSLNF